ncbi:MAG: alpha/beta hydrolase [Chlorobi bacterium]|nr:alpha/beta hydrolase [Chlorobiota bacterium]
MDKVKLYLMPGMGAKSTIFKGLRFPPHVETVRMEWLMPQKNESLEAYTARLISTYDIRPGSVLLGMSFGGVIIHEISKQIPVEKLIFISTVKSNACFPPWYKWGRLLRIWNWLPYGLITQPARTAKAVPPGKLRKRLMLYETYMSIRSRTYFRWAMKSILTWRSDLPQTPWIHIHGDKDRIFPFRYLKGEIFPVNGAGHLAVMTHPKKISRILKAHL